MNVIGINVKKECQPSATIPKFPSLSIVFTIGSRDLRSWRKQNGDAILANLAMRDILISLCSVCTNIVDLNKMHTLRMLWAACTNRIKQCGADVNEEMFLVVALKKVAEMPNLLFNTCKNIHLTKFNLLGNRSGS